MQKFRIYLYIGAALLVISMPLTAFDVNWFGEMKEWPGAFMWLASATLVFGSGGANFHPLLVVYFVVAIFNIPQLIFPFLSNPERGTSKWWVWTFSAAAFVVPALALMMVLDGKNVNGSKSNLFREGYFVYQIGYIISAIGFHLKRKALLQTM